MSARVRGLAGVRTSISTRRRGAVARACCRARCRARRDRCRSPRRARRRASGGEREHARSGADVEHARAANSSRCSSPGTAGSSRDGRCRSPGRLDDDDEPSSDPAIRIRIAARDPTAARRSTRPTRIGLQRRPASGAPSLRRRRRSGQLRVQLACAAKHSAARLAASTRRAKKTRQRARPAVFVLLDRDRREVVELRVEQSGEGTGRVADEGDDRAPEPDWQGRSSQNRDPGHVDLLSEDILDALEERLLVGVRFVGSSFSCGSVFASSSSRCFCSFVSFFGTATRAIT